MFNYWLVWYAAPVREIAMMLKLKICSAAVLLRLKKTWPGSRCNNVFGNMTRPPDTDKEIIRLRVSDYVGLEELSRCSTGLGVFR
jgi:hypothetical protein